MALDIKEIRLECLKLVGGSGQGAHAKYFNMAQAVDNAEVLVNYVVNGVPKPEVPEPPLAVKPERARKGKAKDTLEDNSAEDPLS